MTLDQFDVAATPFPFADGPDVKLRPAVVLSTRAFNEFGMTVMAMVTSAKHSKMPGDVVLDYQAAGLPHPCMARLKIFSIDNRLIEEWLGEMAEKDRASLTRELRRFLPF